MPAIAEVLYEREEVARRILQLGRSITGDYAQREPVLVSVLTGSTMFLADLFRAVRRPVRTDFISISRYGGESESMGRVRLLKDLEIDISGADVLLVEDIVDTGLTLSYLLGILAERDPSSLEVCTLLDKSVRRIAPLEPRYVGFDCPDRYVVGYGLDHRGRYRNLPDILTVDPETLDEDPDALVPFLDPGPSGAPRDER